MFIVTNKTTNAVQGYSKTIHYWSNGYPVLDDIPCAYVKDTANVYEVSEIPEGVTAYKYCYTEADGFYLNPDWIEPEQLYTLDEAAQIIASEVNADV